MIPIPASDVRVFVRVGATDMRKAINGLASMAQDRLKLDPFSGCLFAFCNRRRDLVKLLYWDRNGFCLWQKRLERDRFPWPENESEALEITPQQMGWLLNGIDFRRAHKTRTYASAG
ncbi:MAG: IS66 family insertion sequence element accessory protein TnpB [Leptospirales bacterium]